MVLQHKGVCGQRKIRERSFTSTPLQGLTNMHGRVGGFTNTRGWSSLFSFWGSSDLFEMTSISFSASSSSYGAMVMSGSCEETSIVSSGSLKCSSTIENSSNSTLLDVSAFTVSSESKTGCGGNSSSSIKCSSIEVT
ncbi:hypothetical protein Scep_006915 [Stephania cephalantha]|uniref:Uncharacterized protein n=1 Tax=Stephania cephalantha TaxID=152367 RepID=A0AAP0KAK9_9MAGN